MRTCVAPCAIAASRSPLMPADTTVASGYPRGAGRRLGQPGERPLRLPAQRRHRHQPGQPQRAARRPLGHRRRATVRIGRSGDRPAARSGRRRCSPAPARPAAGPRPRRAAVGQRGGQPDAVHRVHHVGVADHRAGLVALQLADEVPAHARTPAAATSAALAAASWSRFSPMSVTPERGQRAARRWPGTSWSPRPA